MTFIVDKEELKPGLIIFRRNDVKHRNFYCRVKLPNADRYKTISLKTADVLSARERAFDHDADVRFRVKHDVPIFNRTFAEVGKEWLALQEARARRNEITKMRIKNVTATLNGPLTSYVGSTQIHLIGQDRWDSYPAWRKETGKGRLRDKTISDATILSEMSVFTGIMNFAVTKKYVPASHKFGDRPKLKTMRRDEFTLEEYRKLHTVGRSWVAKADRPNSTWYRTVAYNFILIMCNTGMRPPEAKNLRWRDVMSATDREGREIVVLFVRGKGKSRKLVAPKSVGDYLERIRSISKATGPDDPVFSTVTGKPAKWLYESLIEKLLIEAKLRDGQNGVPRTTYCFRHTYATFRLSEGIDVYFLAEQMGTSVKMIEDHYGHVNTIKHADRVLQGMGGWDPIDPSEGQAEKDAKASKSAETRLKPKPARRSQRGSVAA